MLDDTVRRMSVMTRAADLLWPYERAPAREIFRQAYDLAVKDFREHGNDLAPTGISFAYTARPDQRFIVMTAIARRDPATRDFAIASLIMSAQGREQFARAEGLLDKVGDTPLREKLASYLYFRWTQQSVKEGQLDDATRLSKKVPELDYRAVLSFEIASAALKKSDDRARAAELLDAVAAEAEKAPDTPAKARALLGAAHLYADFDVTRASQLLRAAVKVVNLLPNPDFSSETIGREIGNSVFTMYAMYNVPGMRLENAFRELGALDFESALSAASDLSDKYQRALAVLALASKCLEDSATKPSKKKQNRER
jgi:hypothetical protein